MVVLLLPVPAVLERLERLHGGHERVMGEIWIIVCSLRMSPMRSDQMRKTSGHAKLPFLL